MHHDALEARRRRHRVGRHKNAPLDEKDVSKSGLSKAPRVEAAASFEATAPRVVTVPTRRPRRDLKRIKELTIKWGRWWRENKKVLAPVFPDPWVKCDNKIYENTAAIGKRVRVRYPSDDKGRSGAWYNGVITAFNGKTQEHTILFNDGEDKLKLSDETFRIPAAP